MAGYNLVGFDLKKFLENQLKSLLFQPWLQMHQGRCSVVHQRKHIKFVDRYFLLAQRYLHHFCVIRRIHHGSKKLLREAFSFSSNTFKILLEDFTKKTPLGLVSTKKALKFQYWEKSPTQKYPSLFLILQGYHTHRKTGERLKLKKRQTNQTDKKNKWGDIQVKKKKKNKTNKQTSGLRALLVFTKSKAIFWVKFPNYYFFFKGGIFRREMKSKNKWPNKI